MTKEETKTIFGLVRANYPKYYKSMTDMEMKAIIITWSAAFADDNPRAVQDALVQYLRTDTSGYPPTVGQLRAAFPLPDHISGESAWEMVMKNLTFHRSEAIERWNHMPMDVQKALGGYSMLITISGCSIEKDLPFYRKDFLKAYDAICKESDDKVRRGVWQLEYAEARNQLPEDEIYAISHNGKLIERGNYESNMLNGPAH